MITHCFRPWNMETYHQICTTELLSNCKIVKSGAEGVNKIANDEEDDDEDDDDDEDENGNKEEGLLCTQLLRQLQQSRRGNN